ncbi:hypothetical protein G6F68_011117 [Rhizopus microsporus]|nr:hypothetical protein G6F23_011019 [Rhizopus arrhizus]KAG1253898.1 hypothetical protein G6F68_011117 [Rhizopus microsporus]
MTWLFYYKYILCLLPVLLFLHSPPPLRESVDEINQAIHFLQQAIQPISSKQRVFLSLLFSLAWINSVMRSTLTLVWCSIWVIMCLTSQCSIALQAALWFRPERIETEQATERYYCFELHHHQRWWFGTGWGHFLLPQDPPAWSDRHLEPTWSLDQFRLPPPTRSGPPDQENRQCYVIWVWVDPEWQRKEGWQYGDGEWKGWSDRETSTRRERWYRFAKRKECWVQLEKEKSEDEWDQSTFVEWNYFKDSV